jgi:hypothetical protein
LKSFGRYYFDLVVGNGGSIIIKSRLVANEIAATLA